VRSPVDSLLVESPPGEVDPTTCVAEIQTGPPREIRHRGGAVPGEVPTRELGESLVARQPFRRRQPLVEQHEGLLLSFARSKADKALVCEAPEDVDAPLAARVDSCAFE
jgi:hypothetical protein